VTTTLDVTLSSNLQTTLGQAGVYAYAVNFNSDTVFTPLVVDGEIQSSGSVTLDLTTDTSPTLNGGKIYFVIQSTEAGTGTLPTTITQESDLNPTNAGSLDFRYDSFEVSLLNQTGDAGNLTSVNGFGIPMELSIAYADGTTDSKSYNVTGSDVFTGIQAIDASNSNLVDTYDTGPLSGTNRSGLSPTADTGQVAFKPSDWSSYIDSLKDSSSGAYGNSGTVAISGFFNGAADANGYFHNAGFFSYELEWDVDTSYFWLNPTEDSQIKGHIRISDTDLSNSIYSTLGSMEIFETRTSTDAFVFEGESEAAINVGLNNQYGTVLTQVLTGFTSGFYGTFGQSLNANVTDQIDLNSNWNWDPTYAFARNIDKTVSPTYQTYDQYSEYYFLNSNSYGSSYSDNVMRQYAEGGPLLSTWDATTNSNVSTISINLFDDSDTPTGYVKPVIYNIIDEPAGGYALADGSATNGINVSLVFADGAAVLKNGTPIKVEVPTGYDSASGTYSFTSFTVSADGTADLWQTWTVSGSKAAGYSVSGNGAGTTGTLNFTNLPVPADGVTWYRITVGAEGSGNEKTFNFYPTLKGSEFVNPANSGQEADAAIDGGALVTATAGDPEVISMSLNFLYSTTTTIDPDLLTRNTDSTTLAGFDQPEAPVAGALSDGGFTAASGSVTTAEVAFGWSGAGSTTSFGTYTNKISALNVAAVTVAKSDSTDVVVGTSTGTADLDGAWTTSASPLGNGSYVATMTEYAAGDGTLSTPIWRTSATESFTVALDDYGIAANGGGDGLVLGEGAATGSGNWVTVDLTGGTLESGQTILVYAVDSDGNRVSRDGATSDGSVSLSDATRLSIGRVSTDDGGTVVNGEGSVFLREGEELRFAIENGDGTTDETASVSVTVADDAAALTVGGASLTATVDNTLDGDADLAYAQRLTDLPMVYLADGKTIDIRVVQTSDHAKAVIQFAKVDLDMDTLEISVGGLAYSDSDAFANALRNASDPNLLIYGSGQYDQTTTWTVSEGDGYYVPVISTDDELFIIGAANSNGTEHIRLVGENAFAVEDVPLTAGSDADYNDILIQVSYGTL